MEEEAWGSSKERKGGWRSSSASISGVAPAKLRRGGPLMVEEKGELLHGLVREKGLERVRVRKSEQERGGCWCMWAWADTWARGGEVASKCLCAGHASATVIPDTSVSVRILQVSPNPDIPD